MVTQIMQIIIIQNHQADPTEVESSSLFEDLRRRFSVTGVEVGTFSANDIGKDGGGDNEIGEVVGVCAVAKKYIQS